MMCVGKRPQACCVACWCMCRWEQERERGKGREIKGNRETQREREEEREWTDVHVWEDCSSAYKVWSVLTCVCIFGHISVHICLSAWLCMWNLLSHCLACMVTRKHTLTPTRWKHERRRKETSLKMRWNWWLTCIQLSMRLGHFHKGHMHTVLYEWKLVICLFFSWGEGEVGTTKITSSDHTSKTRIGNCSHGSGSFTNFPTVTPARWLASCTETSAHLPH